MSYAVLWAILWARMDQPQWLDQAVTSMACHQAWYEEECEHSTMPATIPWTPWPSPQEGAHDYESSSWAALALRARFRSPCQPPIFDHFAGQRAFKHNGGEVPYLVRLGGRPGPRLDDVVV